MTAEKLGLQTRIDEIRKAIENEMFLSALTMALTVPDICGKLEGLQGNDKEKYIGWVDKHITKQYFPEVYLDENHQYQESDKRAITGQRCYGLRCALLHSGNEEIDLKHMDLEDRSDTAARIGKYKINLLDDPEDEIIYCTYSSDYNGILLEFYMNIRKFCERICNSAEELIKHQRDIDDQYSIELLRYDYKRK